MAEGERRKIYWERAARRLAWHVNAGWWLERCLPACIILTMAATCALLAWRWRGGFDARVFWCVFAALVCAAAVIAAISARRRFENTGAARVRLEDHLGLRSRLTSAAAGVGDWPEACERIANAPVTWHWQRPVAALSLCAMLLAGAALVPVSNGSQSRERIIEKPAALQQVEDWTKKLREEKLADEQDLDAIERKADEIMRRPAEDWYEHASLEAADHLREQTAAALQKLGINSAAASGALSEMGALQPGGGETQEELEEQLQKAAAGLTSGDLKAPASLAGSVKEAADMKNISAEKMKELADKLAKNAQAAREMMENSKWKLDEKLTQNGTCPYCDGRGCKGGTDGEGKPCPHSHPGEGNGEIKRGPGEAPLMLSRDGTSAEPGKNEALKSNIDGNRMALGDATGLSNGTHRVDPNAYRGQSGGAIQNAGQGGEAVWKQSLLPAEREVLKRYFK